MNHTHQLPLRLLKMLKIKNNVIESTKKQMPTGLIQPIITKET
jgi:hypothetical protein